MSEQDAQLGASGIPSDVPARTVEPYATCPHCGLATTPCEACIDGHLLYGDGVSAAEAFPCPNCGGRASGCPDEAGIYYGDTAFRGCEGWVRQIEGELKV